MKEVLGWLIDMKVGMVDLPEQKHLEILQLLSIPSMQLHMGWKELERLVGKLRSMHLSMPGAVAHLYHIQRALA